MIVKVQMPLISVGRAPSALIYNVSRTFQTELPLEAFEDPSDFPLVSYWKAALTCSTCGHDEVPISAACPGCGDTEVYLTIISEATKKDFLEDVS